MKKIKMNLEALEKGHYYHLYNRGNNSEAIFKNDENKRYFLSLMAKHLENTVSILAFCLMDNHYHFLIRLEEEEVIVTQKLSNFLNAYSKACNKRFNRTGSLFEKHFRRKRITDENYLKNVIVYIHRNPVNHGLISDISLFRYSSYRHILNGSLSLPLSLEIDECIDYFDNLKNFKFVHQYDPKFGDEEAIRW